MPGNRKFTVDGTDINRKYQGMPHDDIYNENSVQTLVEKNTSVEASEIPEKKSTFKHHLLKNKKRRPNNKKQKKHRSERMQKFISVIKRIFTEELPSFICSTAIEQAFVLGGVSFGCGLAIPAIAAVAGGLIVYGITKGIKAIIKKVKENKAKKALGNTEKSSKALKSKEKKRGRLKSYARSENLIKHELETVMDDKGNDNALQAKESVGVSAQREPIDIRRLQGACKSYSVKPGANVSKDKEYVHSAGSR